MSNVHQATSESFRMWQLLVAAAVAGSGLFVKRLRDSNSFKTHSDSSSKPFVQIPECEKSSIFRFSSAHESPVKTSRMSRKKSGFVYRGGGNDGNEKRGDGGLGLVVDLRKSRRRFVVCFNKNKKKRSACRNASAPCPPKVDSSFALGFGAGLMCMMSAKSEISRLNAVIDETTKVVQELKTEVARKKTARVPDISFLGADGNAKMKRSRNNSSQLLLNKRSSGSILDSRPGSSFRSNEGECGSSCLTEEFQSGLLMDQLEAELQSELQKLPWCTAEASVPERGSDYLETDVTGGEFDKLDNPDLRIHQENRVLPSELDQKLRLVLLEQQESQIAELESELQKSHSKLNDKEVELQTLKDCIRRLTEVSTDGEIEA